MTGFHRAFLYLSRNKIKTIAFSFIVFILGNLIIGANLMRTSVHQTTERLWENTPGIATSTWDWDTTVDIADTTGDDAVWSKALSPEAIRAVGDLPYVQRFEYSFRHHLWSDQLDWYGYELLEHNHPMGIPGITMNFGVQGVHDLDIFDIQEGIIELVMGETLAIGASNDAYVPALISNELARLNDLTVGDIIVLDDRVYEETVWNSGDFSNEDYITEWNSIELEIVGIFELISTPDNNLTPFESNTGSPTPNPTMTIEEISVAYLKNRIYVPSTILESLPSFDVNHIGSPDFDAGLMPSYFLLYDARDMPAFVELANEILPGGWIIADLSGNFMQLTSAMNSILQIVDGIFWGALISTIIILSLGTLLMTYDRRHEIGVYLALGMKRYDLIKTFLLEYFLVATVALTLAVGSGVLIARRISTLMLEKEFSNQIASGENIFRVHGNLSWFNPGVLPIEEMISIFSIRLDILTILSYLLICLLTIVIAVGLPTWYVCSLNPKKILM